LCSRLAPLLHSNRLCCGDGLRVSSFGIHVRTIFGSSSKSHWNHNSRNHHSDTTIRVGSDMFDVTAECLFSPLTRIEFILLQEPRSIFRFDVSVYQRTRQSFEGRRSLRSCCPRLFLQKYP